MDAGIDICFIDHEDRPAFERLFERLSDQTRYFRFFAPVPRLTKRTLDMLMDVDGHGHTAVGAWRGDELVGEARYVAFADNTAEVAMTVRDDWQRKGVGARMLARVICEAAQRGFCRLTATSLSQNYAVRHLLAGSGFTVSASEDGTDEWERNACESPLSDSNR